MLGDQRGHGLEDHTVMLVVETVRRQLLHGLVHAGRLEEHGTEDGLFCIKSLRRDVSHLKPKCIQIDRLFLLPV